jgi:hypothetical protein
MTVLEIYEKVNKKNKLEQNSFFSYLNDTVSELLSKYSTKLVLSAEEYTDVKSLQDNFVVLPLYHTAIIDNVLFNVVSAEEQQKYKVEFIRKSEDTYKHYWKLNAKSKRMTGGAW